jgi:uncharacterized membrane protein YedE/YeeE
MTGGLWMIEDMSISTLMGIAGLILGTAFGALTHRTNFCAMGAVADIVSFGDYGRFRAWLLAIAVAVLGAQTLHALEMIDLGESIYLGASLNWFGAILGGTVFGFGMVLASGCPGRNLVRVGGGDLKAVVVLLFIGLFGYMTLRGLTAPLRLMITSETSYDLTLAGIESQQIGALVAGMTGIQESLARVGSAGLVAVLLILFCFANPAFRRSPAHIASGIGLGLIVTAGWWATGVLGADDFDPAALASLTFIAPAGDSLQYLMTFTGATIDFGIGSVGGAILGAFLSSLLAGSVRVTSFYDTGDTLRHMAGGALMGFGGVLAFGCTIGQGITGMSTLGLGSILAFLSITFGGVLGVKYMERLLGL